VRNSIVLSNPHISFEIRRLMTDSSFAPNVGWWAEQITINHLTSLAKTITATCFHSEVDKLIIATIAEVRKNAIFLQTDDVMSHGDLLWF
jgi:hypothetical protein